jgi:hypothetical protein
MPEGARVREAVSGEVLRLFLSVGSGLAGGAADGVRILRPAERETWTARAPAGLRRVPPAAGQLLFDDSTDAVDAVPASLGEKATVQA